MSNNAVCEFPINGAEKNQMPAVNIQVCLNQQPQQSMTLSPAALDDALSTSGSSSSQRSLPNLFLPKQGSEEFQRYEEILRGMKKLNTISDIPYHIKSKVQDALDKKKHNGKDWREVASRLKLENSFIEQLLAEEPAPKSPCKEVFEEGSNKKVEELLKALFKMERHDVLNIFHSDIEQSEETTCDDRRQKYQTSKFPSQETTPVSGSSSTSEFPGPSTPRSPTKGGPISPSQNLKKEDSFDSGRGNGGRFRSESNPQQHTDVKDDYTTKVDFHTEESKKFWQSIPPKPDSTRKEWKQFETTLKKSFPQRNIQSQLLRFMCYVLKIDNYDERHNKYINDQDFANMVAWFGPLTAGANGCLNKIDKLIKDSVTYKNNTGAHSFFAGYMTKDEADRAVTAQEKGTFLIRFSATYANEGSFIVVLKTDSGAEHHKIEGNPSNGTLTFDGKTYNDLTLLYKKRLCRGGVSTDKRTSCTITCPDLPLNTMFKSYSSGPQIQPSVGRGRGRGRGQDPSS